jgi:Putative auto-transporter adhesin, head GIN domain
MNACKLAALTAPLMLLTLAGCGDHDVDRGPMTTQVREVDDFDSIEMEGAARLEIAVGAKESVAVEAREEIIDRVRTEVRGDTLHVRSKPKDWFISDGRPRVTVKITLPELEYLKLEGGNDVRLTGLAGGETRIRAEGAAHIKASGHVEELTVHMAGAGHADLSRLLADEAKVTVDGVGSVYVHPKDSLDATMNGVGAILYSGSPREVSTRMNGLGTIGRRKAGDSDRSAEEADAERADEPVDPETLQPEYEEPEKKKTEKKEVNETEVI